MKRLRFTEEQIMLCSTKVGRRSARSVESMESLSRLFIADEASMVACS